MRFPIYPCLLAFSSLFFLSCSNDSPDIENEELSTSLDKTERAAAKKLYVDFYLASASDPSTIAWTGDEPSCEPGTVPLATKDKITMRLAYYRKAAGLNNEVMEGLVKSEKAQRAALMMHANGSLNHSPPNSWKCFTEDGKQAAENSLLTSTSNASAIDSYIRDRGVENGPVGHRRWLLWPRLQEIGIGNTSRYNALWVLGNAGKAPIDAPEFIAWPPQGFVPKPLVFARWSFSIAEADFTRTKISMKNKNGSSIGIEMETLTGIYGDNTIVWRPDIDIDTISEDTSFVVRLQDVGINGQDENFEYQVVVFDPAN